MDMLLSSLYKSSSPSILRADKDKTIQSYSLISLVNMGAELLNKTLTNQIQHFKMFIHHDQGGFVWRQRIVPNI